LTVAVPSTASALRDDCAGAAILVLKLERPRGCTSPAAIIDARDIAQRGAHALYIDGGRVRLETVAAQRGVRPWSAPDALAVADRLAEQDRPIRDRRARDAEKP